MDYYNNLLNEASKLNLKIDDIFQGFESFDSIIEFLQKNRHVFIMKFDGERCGDDEFPYTFIISGEYPQRVFFRVDSNNIKDGMSEVLFKYLFG